MQCIQNLLLLQLLLLYDTVLLQNQHDHPAADVSATMETQVPSYITLCWCAAELLHRMRQHEREHDIEPDWNVHAFQKAQAIQGQRSSVATEYVIRMLGLDICADTICGNHMMRGISGGQKKRVTSGGTSHACQHCGMHMCSMVTHCLLFHHKSPMLDSVHALHQPAQHQNSSNNHHLTVHPHCLLTMRVHI